MDISSLLLQISTRSDITDPDRLVALRVISQLVLAETENTARLTRISMAIASQLNENDNAIIPPFEPTASEVERLQYGYIVQGWDLHYYEPDHNFTKGVFYVEKTRQA